MQLKKKNLISTKLIEYDNEVSKFFTGHFFVGIDEVGRGALAGPVIACAYCFKKSTRLELISNLNDSKQLSSKERTSLIKGLVLCGEFGIGYGTVLEIEKLNILNATFLAMKRAYENLLSKLQIQDKEPYVLIDGNKFNPYINCRQLPIVNGDAKSSLIASASVIAKVYRDELMHKIAKVKKFKYYGWRTNVGYGTAYHRQAIKIHGLTPHHRKLFVRKVLYKPAN